MESAPNRMDPRGYEDVRAELTEMSLRGLVHTVLLGAIGMVGATVVVAIHYQDRVVGVIAVLLTLLAAIRVFVVLRLERSAAYRKLFLASKPRQHVFNAVLLSYFSGLAATTVWNFHLHRQPVEMLCMLGIFILCNGISGRISASPRTAKLHGVVMLCVLAVCLWNPQDIIALTAEAMLAMFAIAHCRAVQEKFDIVVEQIRIQRKLRTLSERDPLTGLLNRRGFCAALDSLCDEGVTFAILFIDLDAFKPVNDAYGHAVGDQLLHQVGERLVSIVRAKDIVARLGGDEFAVLQLPVTQRSNAETLAERITYTLGKPFHVSNHRVTVGASVGISLPSPGEVDSAHLLKRADDALYQAKQSGRGRFVYAEPEQKPVAIA